MKLKDLKIKHKSKAPLYKMERKLNFMPLLIFTLVSVFLLVTSIAVYPVIKDLMPQMLEGLPPELAQIIEQSMGGTTFAGFFATQVAPTWSLIAVIYAGYLAYNLISSNFKGKSSVMLYSLNLSRGKIVFSKVLRFLINNAVLNLFMGVVTLAGALILGQVGQILVNIGIFTLIMTLASALIGFAVFGVCLSNPKKISGFIVIFVAVVLYFVSMLGALDGSLALLSYLSPMGAFTLQTGETILETGFANVNYLLLAAWAVVGAVSFIVGFVSFKNKDLV